MFQTMSKQSRLTRFKVTFGRRRFPRNTKPFLRYRFGKKRIPEYHELTKNSQFPKSIYFENQSSSPSITNLDSSNVHDHVDVLNHCF